MKIIVVCFCLFLACCSEISQSETNKIEKNTPDNYLNIEYLKQMKVGEDVSINTSNKFYIILRVANGFIVSQNGIGSVYVKYEDMVGTDK